LITNYDETIAELKKDIVKTHDALVKNAVKLREYRMKEAKKCETEIIKECRSLDLENTRFEIIFNEVDLSDELTAHGVVHKTYKADGKIAAHAWSIATIFKEAKDCLKETIDFVLPYLPEYF
jgi:DNA repair ATPase RecN